MPKQNMKQWVQSLTENQQKKPLPILSFPSIHLLGVSVKELIGSSDLQSEGMLRIAQNTDAAAAVSLMDLSVEAECFGANIRFSDDEVPTVVGRLIHDAAQADALPVPPVGSARSGLYIDTIRKAVTKISDRPVLAGMIGPFSLAARLLDVSEIMMDCYDDPDMVHTVLKKCTEFLISYAVGYKEAGANGIMMAEPVAGLLSPSLQEEFSAPYVKEIVDAVQSDDFILIYHNCGDNVLAMTDSLSTVGAAAYHFGNAVDMELLLQKMPSTVPVMGNIDPAGLLRMGTKEQIREATLSLMEKCNAYQNFVISSGCDIPPQTPWENIECFFEAVADYYGKV